MRSETASASSRRAASGVDPATWNIATDPDEAAAALAPAGMSSSSPTAPLIPERPAPTESPLRARDEIRRRPQVVEVDDEIDVASGGAREVWKAERGPGSVLQAISAGNQLLWAEGDRIVFPWERTGWLNLYAVAVPADAAQRASAATHLTPGNFEVEHVALSPDRKRVIYSSNQGDIDRRHLWSVGVAGGPPTALTRGAGVEWMPAPVTDSIVAFLRSDAKVAARTLR